MRPGGEVVTAGGIIGTVRSIADREELRAEIAPEVEVRLARKAVAGCSPPERRTGRRSRSTSSSAPDASS
ncbi:MAG: preprotein translocase subunit YajC [Gaiellaceae bacterium]